MMNTSYDNSADSLIPMVEAFPYHDTLGPKVLSDARAATAGQAVEEKTAKNDKGLRTSQEEISRLIAQAHAEGLALGGSQAAARFEEELAGERKRLADLILEFQQ